MQRRYIALILILAIFISVNLVIAKGKVSCIPLK